MKMNTREAGGGNGAAIPQEIPVIEAAGTPSQIGWITGQAMREGIRTHLQYFPPPPRGRNWPRRRDALIDTLSRLAPQSLEEMQAIADGAAVDFDDLLYWNCEPQYGLVEADRCTNVAFADGPDGPIWGKNNDRPAHEPPRPVYARVIRRPGQIPVVIFTYAGLLATADGMNAAGVAIRHSSVGSVFGQSDQHIPIRLWAYEGLFRAQTTSQFIEHMASQPMRGKGYSILCVDAQGDVASLEAACPLLQIRRPANPSGHMQCVNVYQLPALASADRRNETQKCNAHERAACLEAILAGPGPFDLAHMQSILQRTERPAICRSAEPPDAAITEYSMIALPRQKRVLFLYGKPTEKTYTTLTLDDAAPGDQQLSHAASAGARAPRGDALSSLDADELREAIRLGCQWIQDVAQIKTDELPPDTDDRVGFGYRSEDRSGFGYQSWRGAIRGEYHAGQRRWWFSCPLWHTGQAIKALLLASQRLQEPRFLEGAQLGARFILNQQVWDPADPNHGLLLAYEDLEGQVNTSAIMETLDGLMLLADHLPSPQMWQRVAAAGQFLLERLYVPEQGVFLDHYCPAQRRAVQTPFATKGGVVGRPLLEDAVLLKLYDHTGQDEFLQAHLKVSERLVADQNPPGNWVDYWPCHAGQGRFHPRQTYWWALPLIETYRRTGQARFLETAIASGRFCRRAMRADGGYIRGTYTDFNTDSFGHETSGSACAALLFLRLLEVTGDAQWLEPAQRALRFGMRVQFREPQDPNLRGAILEKLMPPDGTDRSPYHLRDLGTIFFTLAATRYLEVVETLGSGDVSRDSPAQPELVQ